MKRRTMSLLALATALGINGFSPAVAEPQVTGEARDRYEHEDPFAQAQERREDWFESQRERQLEWDDYVERRGYEPAGEDYRDGDRRQNNWRAKALADIPPGHMPPPGQCRVWRLGVPPGQQEPPGDCGRLSWRVPAGAVLVEG